jgi:hypothetical protein
VRSSPRTPPRRCECNGCLLVFTHRRTKSKRALGVWCTRTNAQLITHTGWALPALLHAWVARRSSTER